MSKRSSSTSNSNNIIKFILKIIFLLFIVVGYIWKLMPAYSDSYTAALIDKVDRLEELDEAKIVLIGNSNVAFGFNSEYIQKQMGMPVVNMGFHGGLGNTFHDNMMDINVHEGDIYVIAHHSYWNNGKIDDPLLGWITVENNKELWHLVKKEDYLNMIKSFPAYVKKCLEAHMNYSDLNIAEGAYSRKGFNTYGDVSVERYYNGGDYREDIWLPCVDSSEVDDLNAWNKYLTARGARMVVTAFPVVYDQWPSDDDWMDQYQKELEAAMECDVISYWKDYAFDSELFYDTQYHLNSEGAQLRSEQLVKDLRTWIDERKIEQ